MTLPSPPGVVLVRGAESGAREPDVGFRQLRYFVCVAEELHFGRAAARLFMTEPGLSRSIAKLERALDVQLLQRSRRGVQLTDAGLEFLRCARHLMADLDGAMEQVRSVGGGRAGVVRAGVALLAEQVIAPALAAFHAEYQGVVLDRTTAVSERLLAQVSDGSLQVAFVHQVPVLATLTQVDWEVVRRGRLAVLMAQRHPLAGRAAVALGQLREETFLVNPRELAPSAFQGLKLMCAEFGGFDPCVMETETASTPALDAWRPVRQGAAIAVMAEETARGMCPQDVTMVPVQPPPGSAVAVAWRRGDHCALLDQFLGFVRGYRDTNAWLADAPRLSPGAGVLAVVAIATGRWMTDGQAIGLDWRFVQAAEIGRPMLSRLTVISRFPSQPPLRSHSASDVKGTSG
jgi:DNA-binding transcriptional LysR family regulator